MGLATNLLKIKESPWRVALYIPLTVLLGVLLVLSIPAFGIPITGFFLFANAYWFGERRIRFIGLSGIVSIVAIALVFSWIVSAWTLAAAPAVQISSNQVLREGQVAPISGEPGVTLFNFTVRYTGPDQPIQGPVLNLTSLDGTRANQTMSLGDTSGEGRVYYFATRLPASIHRFHFEAQLPNGTWVATQASSSGLDSLGPHTLSAPALFFLYAPNLAVLFLLSSLAPIPVFPLILTLYWWNRQARARRARLLGRGKCPHCGAALIDPSAPECPVCGKALAPEGATGPGG